MRWLAAAVLCALACIAWMQWEQLQTTKESVAAFLRLERKLAMTTVPTPGQGQKCESWFSNVDNDAHYVLSTYKQYDPNETVAAFEARHAAAVAARKVTFPPDYL